jgi:hypothetical protein
LNKNFVRVARPANEKGKGAYWAINPNQDSLAKPMKKAYKKRYGSPRMSIAPSEPMHIVSSAAEYTEHPYIQYQNLPQKNMSYNFEWDQLPQVPNWSASDYSQLEQLLDLDKNYSEYYMNAAKMSVNPSEYYLNPSNEMLHVPKPHPVENQTSGCGYDSVDSMEQFFDPPMWTQAASDSGDLKQFVTTGDCDESQQFFSDQYHFNSDYSTTPW